MATRNCLRATASARRPVSEWWDSRRAASPDTGEEGRGARVAAAGGMKASERRVLHEEGGREGSRQGGNAAPVEPKRPLYA